MPHTNSDYDMQSTFSALTSDVSSQQLSSGESDDMEEEEQEERETEGGVFKLDLQGTGDAPPVGKRAMNGKICGRLTIELYSVSLLCVLHEDL